MTKLDKIQIVSLKKKQEKEEDWMNDGIIAHVFPDLIFVHLVFSLLQSLYTLFFHSTINFSLTLVTISTHSHTNAAVV